MMGQPAVEVQDEVAKHKLPVDEAVVVHHLYPLSRAGPQVLTARAFLGKCSL